VQGELFVAYTNNIQESASVPQIHHHKLTMSQTLLTDIISSYIRVCLPSNPM